MSRLSVDFGIDLGTTNSEVAVVHKAQVRTIRNGFRDEITPSAVRIDGRGSIIVGKLAYNHREDDSANTHTQFKRLMGSQQILSFPASGRKMQPEEASAEILKSLKQDIARELGEEISAAVITVPALFEIPQCEATRRAAHIAGITFSPLLQEPIAAALAYGFQAESMTGFLLVFDLGGGTFDASLIKVMEGRLSVVDHAGDNFLGGKDFDEKLVEHFLAILKRDFGLGSLERGKDFRAFAKLFSEAENAKILLTNSDRAYVSLAGLGRDLPDFEASFEITRKEFEGLIESDVHKAMFICQRLLQANRLSKDDINRIILVGGPTMTPFIRNAVESDLGLKPEYRVDPMTIVAQGAALFAASQKIPVVRAQRPRPDCIMLKLVYKTISQDVEADIAGKIENDSGQYKGIRIQFSRNDGGWSSGQIPISNGSFMTTLILAQRALNEFRIDAVDFSGNSVSVEPNEISITHGPSVEEAPLSRSIRVGLGDNSTLLLISKGTPVPCSARTKSLVTSHEVEKGASDDALHIPLLQGEHEQADRNREIGTLQIKGIDINRSLRANSEIQVVIEVDRDFQVKVQAFIPILNQTFDEVCPARIAPLPLVESFAADLELEKQRLSSLEEKEKADSAKNSVEEKESKAQAQALVSELEADISRAQANDMDSAEKARRRLEDLRAEIDRVEKVKFWPSLQLKLDEAREFASAAVENAGTERDIEKLHQLIVDADAAIKNENAPKLERLIQQISQLGWSVWARTDEAWVSWFHSVAKHATEFVDSRRGRTLLAEGRLAIERADYASLRTIVPELWDLVPDTEETKAEKLRFPSSLRRKRVEYM